MTAAEIDEPGRIDQESQSEEETFTIPEGAKYPEWTPEAQQYRDLLKRFEASKK